MSGFKNSLKLFAVSYIATILVLIPGKCFASTPQMSEAQIKACRDNLIVETKKYIGCPYVRGATGPDKFDCSGLIYYVCQKSIQMQVPRTVKTLYSYVQIIPESKREPGDLVFFRTVGDSTISHVGLYVGNEQFISAVSDGPNTGVILSSLRENYWKAHYAGSGKFLGDSTGYVENKPKEALPIIKIEESRPKSQSTSTSTSRPQVSKVSYSSKSRFSDHIYFNADLTGDWSLFTEKRFMMNFRGLSNQVNVLYEGDTVSFGLGTMFRWNFGVKTFQIPLLLSLTFNDYIRAYAGPMFNIGKCYAPDTDDRIDSSIFPGIMGFSFMTPSFTKGDLKVRLVQDINYTVYNNRDGAALSFLQSASSGLVFSTGLSVTFPLKMCMR